jgi:hypothetical protein
MVERGHIGYQCTLPLGHIETTGEPHYAVEVDASVRAWQRWHDLREETPFVNDRKVQVQAEPDRVVTTADGTGAFVGNKADQDREVAKHFDYVRCNRMLGNAVCYLEKGHPGDHLIEVPDEMFGAEPGMADVNKAHLAAMGIPDVKLGEPITEDRKDRKERCGAIHPNNLRVYCVLKPGHTTNHAQGSLRWSSEASAYRCTSERLGGQCHKTVGHPGEHIYGPRPDADVFDDHLGRGGQRGHRQTQRDVRQH